MSKKTALIDATKSLLWEKGYEATSPKDIQALSAAGQGSFYHHFGSKKELAATALHEISKEMCGIFSAQLGADGPAGKRLTAYLTKQRKATRGCCIGRLANEASMQDPDLAKPIRDYFDQLENLLSDAIREGQQTGEIADRVDPADLAITVIAAIQGGFVLGRMRGEDEIHQTIARALTPLLILKSA